MRGRISSGMTTGWAKTTNCILLPMISMVSILPCFLLLLVLHLPNLLLHKNMFSKYFTLVALCGLSYHLINLPTSLARCLIPDHSSLSHHISTSALHFISFSARLGLLFMTIVRLVSLNKKNFNTKKLFKYLKIVKEREGNVACEQFYQELLSSYGKYLQVLSFLGVTKIFNV